MSSHLEDIFGWAESWTQNTLGRAPAGEAHVLTLSRSRVAGLTAQWQLLGRSCGWRETIHGFIQICGMNGKLQVINTSKCRRWFAIRLPLPEDLGQHIGGWEVRCQLWAKVPQASAAPVGRGHSSSVVGSLCTRPGLRVFHTLLNLYRIDTVNRYASLPNRYGEEMGAQRSSQRD